MKETESRGRQREKEEEEKGDGDGECGLRCWTRGQQKWRRKLPSRRSNPIKTERKSWAWGERTISTFNEDDPPSPLFPSFPAPLLQLATLQINVRESANMQHATVSCSVFFSYSFSFCLLLCRNICKYSKLCADLFTDSRALGMAMLGSRSGGHGEGDFALVSLSLSLSVAADRAQI